MFNVRPLKSTMSHVRLYGLPLRNTMMAARSDSGARKRFFYRLYNRRDIGGPCFCAFASSCAGGAPIRSATDLRLGYVARPAYISSLGDCTETGPFTVERRIMAGELPNSMRRVSSSQVLLALSQICARQLIGPYFDVSTTKLDR